MKLFLSSHKQSIMKKILLIIVLNCLMFFSCKKTLVTNTSIMGRWTLVETLTDPGDDSGKWMPINTPHYYFIKFDSGDSIESNLSRGNGEAFKYKILTDSTLYLIYGESDTVSYSYAINSNFLTLEGGCYERCGIKFKKDH